MATVSVHEAKTHLSRLINDVLAGKEVIVSRGKQEVVKIVPLQPKKRPDRELGWLAHQNPPDGRSIIGPAFWEPLSNEEMGIADRDDDPLSPNYRR
jgi:prevent-host-death family protein